MPPVLICIALLSPAPSGSSVGNDTWAAFLAQPSDAGHRAVTAMVKNCRVAACERDVAPDSSAVAKLVEWIGKGQKQAIDLAFLCRRLLDGGDLEDVSRGLGMVADSHPRLFLEGIKRHRLAPQEWRGILLMMPASTIDDEVGRRHALKERIRSLSTVSDPDLRDARNEALSVLRGK